MKKYSFALATLVILVAPLAASAYSYMPMYRPSYSYPSDPRYSMYNVQLGAQAMSLQNQRYYIGSDCTDYGYGDCAERLAWSGSAYGPGWMVTGPQQSYGGGYYGGYGQYQPQYQPSYYGGGYGYGNNYYGGNAYSGGYGNNYGGYNPYGSYNPYGGYYGY